MPLINADDTDPQNRLPSFRKNREMMGTGSHHQLWIRDALTSMPRIEISIRGDAANAENEVTHD